MANIHDKYKKHELRDHIYVLPAMYIGSADLTVAETYIYDDTSKRMIKKELSYVPGLYKIFDEIIVNAIDQTTRLNMSYAPKDAKQVKNIWVTINKETGEISVTNDGDGIDIDKHPEHKVWIPELIFGELLTSTNYDQSQEKRAGGTHGIGAKATNIFSKDMVVETVDWRNKKIYKQRFFNNMKEREPAIVKAYSKTPFTRITFTPDYARFGIKGMTDDIYELFKKRVYDCCATTPASVTVYFNDVKLDAKTFERYTDLYLGDKVAWPRAYEASADGYWEVVATYSEHGVFDQVSFVNGINTIRGGKHVDYISNQIAKNLVDMMTKKKKNASVQHIKANLMVFIKSSIVNPSFDSQSKETLNTPVTKFGSKFEVSDKFMAALYKTGIADRASSLTAFHDTKKASKTDGKKTSRIIVPKLDDANLAGTKYSEECTLCLTEGDSARTMAIAGLSVVGRDRYGVFPLRGKILNVKDAALTKISQNEEITNLKKILGLEQGKNYADKSSLRYGKIMILTDQDTDGFHIKGLLFNIFESLWPTLYKMDGFLTSMMTPIIKVFNKSSNESHVFYNESDYKKWKDVKEKAGPMKGWSLKYYKGLGTSTEQEAKEYFSNPKMITYTYSGAPSDEGLNLAFNKKRADDRKDWLMHYEPERVLDYNAKNVSYEDFVHKELIHFSNRDLERSINHICDGLKESTRKILYGCLKRRLFKNEIKVAQLAAYVSEVSAYHHGEASLQQAITGMAQVFVGTNNINILQPNGAFGSRYQGGNDAASPRYIYTLLSELARAIYREEDSPVLSYLDDDGSPVEPTYYIPIICMVLVNGALGIGTGFSTNVPQHNPSDIIAHCEKFIEALDVAFKKSSKQIETTGDLGVAYDVINTVELQLMNPWYLGFNGTIFTHKEGSFASRGAYRWIDDTTVEITELPIGVWTDDYKEFLEGLVSGGHPILKNFVNHCTTKSIKFHLTIHPGSRAAAEAVFETEFKMVSTKNMSLNNIHLYTAEGAIKKYKDTNEVCREWACTRLEKYLERKNHQLHQMEQTYILISAKVRFIQEIIDEKLKIMNKKIKEVEAQLIAGKYPSIKEEVKVKAAGDIEASEAEVEEAASVKADGASGYSYLTRMPIHQLTYEKKQALEKEAAEIKAKIEALRATPIHHIWRNELRELTKIWEAYKNEVEADYVADRESKVLVAKKKTAVRGVKK